MPFRPISQHGAKPSQDIDLNGTSDLAIPKPANGAPKSGPDAVSVLEAKANGF